MIETKRLQISEITREDIPDIYEYAKDEETGPRAGWSPHQTIEDTKKIVELWLSPNHHEQCFGLVYKLTGKVIGTMGVTCLNEHLKDNRNIFANKFIKEGKCVYEIGATLSKKYWNMGLITEALSAMLKYLFKQVGADIVLTLHYEANIGSKKVQEKNNMKVLGCYEHDEKWYNTNCTTMVVRGKTRQEWLKE
ncbi:MAG: GNAT family N-acetyltransferase [Clostridia bacterium]|nr:GNAT family N-acetyltransferase [Clostridia bacterium]